jgi:hypothetical protein
MWHHEAPRHNGHAGRRLATHSMHFNPPRRGPEFGPGASNQRVRIILFANETDRSQHIADWVDPEAPAAMIKDGAEPVFTAPQCRITCLRYYPEPGQEVVASWSDVRELVTGQLANPERLRHSHRLRCHAQVYEALAPQRLEMLARAMLGDASLATELHPLADWLVMSLGLAATLPPKPVIPPQRREPGIVFAGDRLLRIRVADDPTQEIDTSDTRDCHPARAAAAQLITSPKSTTNSVRRSAIPKKYLKPQELRRSREDAIYEMHFEANPGWWRRLLRAFRGSSVSRREHLRWQIMLSGKEIEDQLWSVRPPTGGFRHPKVRDWATRTLALVGYDPALMLAEWEIYWRRKAD